MQKGINLMELASEVDRRSSTKRDFIASSGAVRVRESYQGDEHEALGRQIIADIGDETGFGINETAHRQFADKLQIPKMYYDRMRERCPDLLVSSVNRWLDTDPDRQRMIRTMDGHLRAVVSDRFRCLDDVDMLEMVIPKLQAVDLEIEACNINDNRLYICGVTPRLKGDVKVGDTVQAGVVIENSETGFGKLKARTFLKVLKCLNGQVGSNVFAQVHTGRQHHSGTETDAAEFFSDSTKLLDDAALYSKMSDAVDYALSEECFGKTLDQLRNAADVQVEGDPMKAVEAIAKEVSLTSEESGAMLRNLITGGDLSAWGVANSVTALAHTAESFTRNVELQEAGTTIVEMACRKDEFHKLIAQAA